MARYSSAMSWLFVAGLALSNAAVAVSAVETIEAQDMSSVSMIEPNAVQPNEASVWSWPDAITKTIGREPVTDWKEYLFKDPFGEGKDAIESSNLPMGGLRKPKNNKGDQINWNGGNGVRGWWTPSIITCPFGGSMDVDYYGQEKCIGVGQGICKDGWQFGIRQHGDNTYLMLWREDNPMNPVFKSFPGATQLCIGELYPNVAYLSITYEDCCDDCLYFLIGKGAGDRDHLARLKIVPDTQKYKQDDAIVKFRDGPGDDNTLWQIFANGMSKRSYDTIWYPLPCCSQDILLSPFDQNNGFAGNMFDVTAKEDIAITGIVSVNLESLNSGAPGTVQVYTKAGSYAGFETDSSAWSFWGSAEVQIAGINNQTFFPPDTFSTQIEMNAGETRSFFVYAVADLMRYTDGDSQGALRVEDDSLQLFTGIGRGDSADPFAGEIFSPRSWNGEISYTSCSTGISSRLGISSTAPIITNNAIEEAGTTGTTNDLTDNMTKDQLWVWRNKGNGTQSF